MNVSFWDILKFEKAENLYKEIIKINPNYINAITNYANLKFQLDQYEDAIELYNRALKIDNKGLLKDKKIYRLEDMDDSYKFSEDITSISYKNNSFIYNLLTSIKQRINAPVQRAQKQK